MILDEVGYVPFTKTEAELLYQFRAARYERGSMIVTTNLEFSQWTEVFGDAKLTGALLDRLTHRAHILVLNGESYRFRESLKRQQQEREKLREPAYVTPKRGVGPILVATLVNFMIAARAQRLPVSGTRASWSRFS